jgi:ribosome-binding protein aMBF1 (putative translation factor)
MKPTVKFDNELKNIKLLGYTTDFLQCECCGREVKGTISILDIDKGVVLHFGTTCAANANKYDNYEVLKAVKKEINSIKKRLVDNAIFASDMCRKYKLSVNREIVISDYQKYMENKENRLKRFNWEKYL